MKDLLVKLDPIARKLGFYSAYELSSEEYLGEIKTIDDDGYGYLKYALTSEMGYEKSPKLMGIRLEAAKISPHWATVHDYSYRKVDPENPRWQWHIHVWENSAHSEIYSHYEYRPDVTLIDGESVSEAIERLRTHYRPSWGEDYLKGEMCDDVKKLVD